MNNTEIYPWQHALWQHLLSMRTRMPHAILLQGRQGIGKQVFAQALAHALLCESPSGDGSACGVCPSCAWLAQGNHPDFRMIEPDDGTEDGGDEAAAAETAKTRKKSRYILVDQIRGLNDLVGLSSHRHGLRVVVLHPAEALNANAANALLKILEEPPPATLFLLVSHQSQRLLPTIRSRCHKIAMPMPSRRDAEAWLSSLGVSDPAFCLAQSGGAPLLALEADRSRAHEEIAALADQLSRREKIDPAVLAAHWSKEDYGIAINSLQKWSYDLMLARLAGRVRYHPAQLSSLQAMGKGVDLAQLLDFQRLLAESRAQATHPLNTELQLEALLVRYAQLFQVPART